jgi:hypothetical protein
MEGEQGYTGEISDRLLLFQESFWDKILYLGIIYRGLSEDLAGAQERRFLVVRQEDLLLGSGAQDIGSTS